MKMRTAQINRKTGETDIALKINLDGSGRNEVDTGIGFLNHMLELFSYHGKFDIALKARGDLEVDIHHTNEDIGIVLGEAFDTALAQKKGIRRFGFFCLPMGESLVRVALDIAGRPSLNISGRIRLRGTGDYKFSDLKHFLEGFVRASGINLHLDILKGNDFHHVSEAVFKALAQALRNATERDFRTTGVPSTKGRL